MQTAKPKGLAKIWREIKRPFERKIETAKKLANLRACKSEANAVFGEPSEISKAIDSLVKFYRWKGILGGEIAKFLHIKRQVKLGRCAVFAQHVGIELEKEIQLTDEALILDNIKLPHPQNEADKGLLWEYELSDIVFPSYFKHNFDGFDCYCDTFKNGLEDFNEGPYEYGSVCLNEGDVVFDCGANMGLFSAVASRYGATVFAFEAIPEIIDNYLSKTARMNGNIHIHNFAVWDKEEMLEFSLMPDNIGGSRVDELLLEGHLRQNRRQFTVPAITLDAFVEKNNIERVDFIKADIEGAERNMLRGAKMILREFAPKLSICTYHLPDDPQVLREIILDANPEYRIVEKFSKMYAYVPKSASMIRTQPVEQPSRKVA